MRKMNPPFRTIRLATSSPLAAREQHVALIGIKAGLGIIARREMNISTQRGRISITVHIWESRSSTGVVRVLNADTVETVGVCGVGRCVVRSARTCPLNGLDGSCVRV